MKVCNKCGIEKSKTEFYPRPERPCGVQGVCKACKNASRVAWAKAHPRKTAAALARSYKRRRARRALLPADVQRALADAHTARAAKWRAEHPGENAKSVALWNEKHPGKTARYRARRFQATPKWANEFFIEEAYALAKLRTELTGIEWNVDHIVPLNSKKVCGLHVENNLRVIPAKHNRSKGNRYWPDMPDGVRVTPMATPQ